MVHPPGKLKLRLIRKSVKYVLLHGRSSVPHAIVCLIFLGLDHSETSVETSITPVLKIPQSLFRVSKRLIKENKLKRVSRGFARPETETGPPPSRQIKNKLATGVLFTAGLNMMPKALHERASASAPNLKSALSLLNIALDRACLPGHQSSRERAPSELSVSSDNPVWTASGCQARPTS